jgi:hypothetical protein
MASFEVTTEEFEPEEFFEVYQHLSLNEVDPGVSESCPWVGGFDQGKRHRHARQTADT